VKQTLDEFLLQQMLNKMAADVGISTTGSIPDYEWEQMLRRNKASKDLEQRKHNKTDEAEET